MGFTRTSGRLVDTVTAEAGDLADAAAQSVRNDLQSYRDTTVAARDSAIAAASSTVSMRGSFIPVFADEAVSTALAVDGGGRVTIGVDRAGNLIAPSAPPIIAPLKGQLPVFADEAVLYAGVVDNAGRVAFGVGVGGRVIASGLSQQVLPVFADEGWVMVATDTALGIISGVKADGTAFPASGATIVPPVAASGLPLFVDESWLMVTVSAAGGVVSGIRTDGTAYPVSSEPFTGWTPYLDNAGRVALLSASKGVRIAKPVGTIRPAPALSFGGLVTWADDQGAALPEFRQFSLGGAKAVPAAISRMVMIPQMGQSNGIGSGGFPAVTRAPVRPGRAFAFNGGTRVVQPDPALGNWEQGASDNRGELRSLLDQQIVGLADMQEADVLTGKNASWYGETSISGMAWSLTAALPASVGVLGATFAIGGASLAQQAPGSPMFNNVIRSVERAKAFCDLLGIPLEVPAVLWNQGEADRANDPASYRANWRALQAALTTSINAITGGTGEVVMVFDQNTSWTQSVAIGAIPVAQLAEAIANPGRFQMAMPQYISTYRGDAIHLDNVAFRKRGEYEGRAIAAIRAAQQAGTALTPTTSGALFVTGVAVAGTTITISTTATSQLVIDTAWVTDPGQYGLRVFDAAGTEIALSNIAISGTSQITATLASALTAGTAYTLGVADKGTIGTKAGRTIGPRACFRDSSADLGSDGLPLYAWAAVQQFPIQ